MWISAGRGPTWGLLALAGVLACAPGAFGGGVAVVRTVLADNGDHDSYADTQETSTARMRTNCTAFPSTVGPPSW